ncbi:MAG: caspase family protein, partial [Actinobacteria bacterium]|nr:caspase family protein [Actinomycetota bacterium]
MRPDRPSLRGRLTALDARLASPAATRGLATLVGALLLVQGAVVLERTAAAPGAPEIGALEPAPTDATGTAADTTVAIASAPLVPDVTEGSTDVSATVADGAADTTAAAAPDVPGQGQQSSASTPSDSSESASSPSSTGTTAASDPARRRFESRFPEHARAGQNTAKPGTTRWAVLIGVNEHSGRTRDNVGSRQDAEDLARHLLSLGWARDHVLLLTDATANRENIVEGLRWLQRKSDEHSVVVVHYSGHVKQWHGRDADGDREVPDEAFWPSDNRFITDREVGDLLG